MSLAAEKAAIRAQALARRDALDPACRSQAAARIADRILARADSFADGPVSVFWPIRSEIDTVPLMHALSRRGLQLALPVVKKPALIFRAWKPGEPLREAGFGLSEPEESALQVIPVTMLVPLAAFDAACNRIGYGAGFYDRTIAVIGETAPPLTIGLAFAVQQVDCVPTERHDRRLDGIVTEDRVFGSRGNRA